MSENPERLGQSVDEIAFGDLAESDTIRIKTVSGSVYDLEIIDDSKNSPVVKLRRESDHPVKMGDTPVDRDFNEDHILLGCGHNSLSSPDGDELSPLRYQEGVLIVGKQACLVSEAGAPLITSTVVSLEIDRSD